MNNINYSENCEESNSFSDDNSITMELGEKEMNLKATDLSKCKMKIFNARTLAIINEKFQL